MKFTYIICSSLNPGSYGNIPMPLPPSYTPFVSKTRATHSFILLIMKLLRNPKIDTPF